MTRALLCVLFLALAAPAFAQDEAARASAHEHFERGLELFNEGRLDAALAEFLAAYDAAPAPAVLYNLGRVYMELGRPVEAADALARYLETGGPELREPRRSEVEALLSRARARIGHVDVVSSVEGAVVSVDGVDVATTPLEAPLALGAGRHTIGVHAPGHDAATFAVDVAGGVTEHVTADLRPAVVPRGALRIEASPGTVEISIDGVRIGTTPLDATIPVDAGPHDVVGTRPGYLSDERHVVVEDGAELDVHLHLERDPSAGSEVLGVLVLSLPEGRVVVRVDGVIEDADGPISLPIGDHALVVEAEERLPWNGTTTLEAGGELRLSPGLEWTPDARRERRGAAGSMRTAGIVVGLVGAAVLVGGLVTLGWNESEIASTDARIVALDDQFEAMCRPTIMLGCDAIAAEVDALTARQSEEDVIRAVSATGVGLGAALGVLGLVLALSAPSDADVDAAARATLHLGPTGLVLDGSF